MNGRSEYACPERHACRESSAVCFFGLRAECGCGSRPAGVLHSTNGAPRLHGGGPAAGRPGSLELRAHYPLGPFLGDGVRASRSRTANCPRETLQALRTPPATGCVEEGRGAAGSLGGVGEQCGNHVRETILETYPAAPRVCGA